MERKNKVSSRWTVESSNYRSVKSQLIGKQRKALLQTMRVKARDIQFLNSLRSKYSGMPFLCKKYVISMNIMMLLWHINTLHHSPNMAKQHPCSFLTGREGFHFANHRISSSNGHGQPCRL